jgi:hypothetical protein
MGKMKVWISVVGVLLLASCIQKEKSDSKSELVRININLPDKTEVYDTGNDVEPEWDICALETNDDCLLGFVRQIYCNPCYFIPEKASGRMAPVLENYPEQVWEKYFTEIK